MNKEQRDIIEKLTRKANKNENNENIENIEEDNAENSENVYHGLNPKLKWQDFCANINKFHNFGNGTPALKRIFDKLRDNYDEGIEEFNKWYKRNRTTIQNTRIETNKCKWFALSIKARLKSDKKYKWNGDEYILRETPQEPEEIAPQAENTNIDAPSANAAKAGVTESTLKYSKTISSPEEVPNPDSWEEIKKLSTTKKMSKYDDDSQILMYETWISKLENYEDEKEKKKKTFIKLLNTLTKRLDKVQARSRANVEASLAEQRQNVDEKLKEREKKKKEVKEGDLTIEDLSSKNDEIKNNENKKEEVKPETKPEPEVKPETEIKSEVKPESETKKEDSKNEEIKKEEIKEEIKNDEEKHEENKPIPPPPTPATPNDAEKPSPPITSTPTPISPPNAESLVAEAEKQLRKDIELAISYFNNREFNDDSVYEWMRVKQKSSSTNPIKKKAGLIASKIAKFMNILYDMKKKGILDINQHKEIKERILKDIDQTYFRREDFGIHVYNKPSDRGFSVRDTGNKKNKNRVDKGYVNQNAPNKDVFFPYNMSDVYGIVEDFISEDEDYSFKLSVHAKSQIESIVAAAVKRFINDADDKGMIARHAISHGKDTLNKAVKLIEKYINSRKNIHIKSKFEFTADERSKISEILSREMNSYSHGLASFYNDRKQSSRAILEKMRMLGF